MDVVSHDVLVIGGGLAGLRAAIAAVQQGASVALVSKVYPMRSHTVAAEGGAAGVVRTDTINALTGEPMTDSLALHALDTVKGSDFLADQNVVEYFVTAAPDELIQLEHWGCPWSRDEDGRIAVRTFGGMSTHRTVFAADKSGFHMLHAIFQTSLKYDGIVRYDENFATSLLMDDGRCQGAVCMDQRSGQFRVFTAKATILATGGCGRLWAFTTNGFINTGDGHGLAYRAGAPLSDMEFPQYHPTGLPGTGILITEAVRSEGGYLLNKNGDRFLSNPDYGLGQRMELGPRDIISRAEITEMEAGRGIPGRYGDNVLLDLRHLGAELIDRKLPFVRELAQRYIGIDPVKDPIPVRPVEHYMMGGVRCDIDGASRLPGLYAAGECAQEGLNGANRLGSNSLTECLVFGARTGAAAARFAGQARLASNAVFEAQGNDEEQRIAGRFGESSGDERVGPLRAEMQQAMEDFVGVYRTGDGMKEGAAKIRSLKERFTRIRIEDHSKTFNLELQAALELDTMLELAQTVVEPAILREESRGSQARRDFPNRDDEHFLAHSLAFRTPDGPRVEWDPVVIITDPKDMLFEHDPWVPVERKY